MRCLAASVIGASLFPFIIKMGIPCALPERIAIVLPEVDKFCQQKPANRLWVVLKNGAGMKRFKSSKYEWWVSYWNNYHARLGWQQLVLPCAIWMRTMPILLQAQRPWTTGKMWTYILAAPSTPPPGTCCTCAFWTKFLKDMGHVSIEEPMQKLTTGDDTGRSNFVYRMHYHYTQIPNEQLPDIYVSKDLLEKDTWCFLLLKRNLKITLLKNCLKH